MLIYTYFLIHFISVLLHIFVALCTHCKYTPLEPWPTVSCFQLAWETVRQQMGVCCVICIQSNVFIFREQAYICLAYADVMCGIASLLNCWSPVSIQANQTRSWYDYKLDMTSFFFPFSFSVRRWWIDKVTGLPIDNYQLKNERITELYLHMWDCWV